jgi:outer membrane protein assembly factor BamB
MSRLFWSATLGLLLWSTSPGGEQQSVVTYHGDPARSGHYVVPGLTWERARQVRSDSAFRAEVAGHVYAQPLYWKPSAGPGVVVVATEDNVVQAVNAATGAPVWRRSLGAPVPRSDLPCGNIDPMGITGTPAIDARTQSVILDAMTNGSGGRGPLHLVFALSLRDGSVLPGWPVNVADALRARGLSFEPEVQGQRGALLVQDGSAYVPYGGHWGDCGRYRGWVVRFPLDAPTKVSAWSTRGPAGGIWAPGGIASDGRSLYVATGNTIGSNSWSDGEAIIRLSPQLTTSTAHRDFFAPADWRELDDRDADLGGVAPLPLDLPGSDGTRGLILALGKNGKAYLADRDDLGGIGGELASDEVAKSSVRTAPAMWRTKTGVMIAFAGHGVACPAAQSGSGLVTLAITGGARPAIRTAWCAPLDGAGAPIVTTSDGTHDPIVWVTGAEGDGRLHGFRGDTGEELFGGNGADAMQGLRRFGTILAADGRLYVAGDGKVYAFTP